MENIKDFAKIQTRLEMLLHGEILDRCCVAVTAPKNPSDPYVNRPEGSESKLNTYSDGIKVLLTIAKLFRVYKPLAFFGIVALVLLRIATGFFIPVLVEFIQTGLVPKFPTLIACGFVTIAAIQSFFTGMLLESIRHKNKQDFEMDLIHIQNNFNRLKNQ